MRDAWIIGGGVSALAAAHELSMSSHVVHLFAYDCAADDGAEYGYIHMHGYSMPLDGVQDKLGGMPPAWRPEYVVVADPLDEFTDYVYGICNENNIENYQAYIREEIEEMGPAVTFVGPETTLRVMNKQTAVLHARWSVRSLLKGEDLVH